MDVSCDPALGCTQTPIPLEQDCCVEEPAVRFAEPDIECPAGSDLLIGRNSVGFGRLLSCDRLGLIRFGQGGVNMRIHVAARCLATEEPVEVEVTLETVDRQVGSPVRAPRRPVPPERHLDSARRTASRRS